MKARIRCTICDRPLKAGRRRYCVRGCGAPLCRAHHVPPCGDVHGGQCPHLQLPEDEHFQTATAQPDGRATQETP